MIIYLTYANFILAEYFRNKIKEKLTSTYKKLKKELNKRGFIVNLHIPDNEAPEMHMEAIEESN